jgi:hypothetical protein
MKILFPLAALAAVTLLAGAALSLSRETQARVAELYTMSRGGAAPLWAVRDKPQAR